MRVLVTGASGFMGKTLLSHPKRAAHAVFSACRGTDLDTAITSFRPDTIIHLAGRVGGIADNLAHPIEFLTENLAVGLEVLDVAMRCKIPRLINLGSSCMYPIAAPQPFCEEALGTGPVEPSNEGYAIAKIAIARLCDFAKQDGFNYKTLVPPGLYGPFGHFEGDRAHAVNAMIARIYRDKTFESDYSTIWGDGTARREFLFAPDLADCIWRAVEEYDSLPSVMNVGTGVELSIHEWASEIAQAVGFTGKFLLNRSRPSGVSSKVMDVSKARDWGWSAPTSVEEGLRQTVEWYQAQKEKKES